VTEVVSNTARLAEARRAIRIVERYLYAALGEAEEGSPEAKRAQDEMRLAVGLRRKLDTPQGS
jgi:hypothetical protein